MQQRTVVIVAGAAGPVEQANAVLGRFKPGEVEGWLKENTKELSAGRP